MDYAYFKDNYKLIAVGLNKRNALDADPRATQQLVFQGFPGQKLIQYIFLKKSKVTVRIFQRNSKGLQVNNLKPAVKNQTGVTLRMNMKIFEGKNSPHELHCVKSVRIRSYSGPHYSHIFPHSD